MKINRLKSGVIRCIKINNEYVRSAINITERSDRLLGLSLRRRRVMSIEKKAENKEMII